MTRVCHVTWPVHRGSEEGNVGRCMPGCFQQQVGLELGFQG